MLNFQEQEYFTNLDRKIPLRLLLNITSIKLADAIDNKDGEAIKLLFEMYCKFESDLKMLDKCNKL